MSEMTREMLDYPAVNPQTCILAVDNPESGYCIVPASAMRRYAESHDALVKALETAAARFNMMAGVGLVNGADPKVGYRECMDALALVGTPGERQ